MTLRTILAAVSLMASVVAITSCDTQPREAGPPVEAAVIAPGKIVDFRLLYSKNCAGCHGPDGKGGVAVGLGDPVYLTIADDATIGRIAADGVPGTSMPAFAQHSGGLLTDDQIKVIVGGIRAWAKPGVLGGAQPPPYVAEKPGDPAHGAAAYGVYCASCHGAEGRGAKASSIVNGTYLALVSDQNLRTTVIVGRPDLGAPDWRSDAPGKAMSPEDVSDVVAWLSAQRPKGGSL